MLSHDYLYVDSPLIDYEFENFLKIFKGRSDFETQEIRHKFRLIDRNYFHHIQRSVTQSVVIKIISKGTTSSHLNILLNYVSRNLESQKDEEKTPIFNQENDEIFKSDFSELIADWSENFEKFSIEKEDKEISDQIDMIKNELETKYFERGLTSDEGSFLKAINLFEERNYSQNGFYEGTLCKDKGTGDLGFILKDEYAENAHFYSMNNYPSVSKLIVPCNNLEILKRDIQKAIKTKPRNFSHIVLSAGGDYPDANSVLEATKDFLEINFKAQGYDYVYTLHNDTKNPHIHVILNNHSKQNDYKFSPNKYDLQELRMDYTRHLDGYGVNRTAVLKYDRADFLERVEKEIQNNQSYDLNWYQHKLNDKKDTRFDLLKFKKRSLHALDSMSKKLEYMDQKDLAQKIKEQKNQFINLERDKIGKVIENTMQILEKNDQTWRKYCEDPFMKTVGKPKDFEKDGYKLEKTKELMIEKYEAHLEKTKEDLEELSFEPLSDKMEKRREKAINYINKRLIEVDKALGRDPRDLDFGREMEMER